MSVVVDIVVNVETDGGPDRGVVIGFNTGGEVVFISVKEIMIRSSHVHCKSTLEMFFSCIVVKQYQTDDYLSRCMLQCPHLLRKQQPDHLQVSA